MGAIGLHRVVVTGPRLHHQQAWPRSCGLAHSPPNAAIAIVAPAVGFRMVTSQHMGKFRRIENGAAVAQARGHAGVDEGRADQAQFRGDKAHAFGQPQCVFSEGGIESIRFVRTSLRAQSTAKVIRQQSQVRGPLTPCGDTSL